MPKQKSSSPNIHGACLLPLIAGCILAIIVVVTLVVSIPIQAGKVFGPPSLRLGDYQHLTLSLQLLLQKSSLTKGRDLQATPQPFRIELGETTSSICSRLQSEGVISNSDAFQYYLLYSGLDISLQAGVFSLSAAQTPLEIAQALQDPTPEEVTFGVLAGWRMEEIATVLPTSGLNISPEDFLSAARSRPHDYVFAENLPDTATFEGFLTPGVYEIPRELSASELTARLAGRFDEQMTTDLLDGFTSRGMNLYQAVVLASIIEREAVLDVEMPMIASVFLNRLTIGMKLDSDPTVQYAIGYQAQQNTWWVNPVVDTNIDSPYNTYMYAGLPPGPISNPSMTALNAVAFPAQTGFYFFRAACDHSGRHIFAVTYEEHKANSCP